MHILGPPKPIDVLVWVLQCLQNRGHTLLRFHEQVLEIHYAPGTSLLMKVVHTSLASTPGTPNAMDVVLDLSRHVEVYDVLDREIQPLGGDVCGHEHVLQALVELDSLISLRLVLATVDTGSLHPL